MKSSKFVHSLLLGGGVILVILYFVFHQEGFQRGCGYYSYYTKIGTRCSSVAAASCPYSNTTYLNSGCTNTTKDYGCGCHYK